MTLHLGNVDAGLTLYLPWHTFDSNGSSITLTGLAVTDVEIYKNGSVTQRSSDAGYALLDTDGIDFDGITGIHGISIDLADNTDAGFYSAGAFYWVVISAVTVDTRTINFVLATFRIGPAAANFTQLVGDAQSATDLKDFADAGYDPATNKVEGVKLADTLTTYTGDTPQTGDSFARIGATGSGLTSLATQASVDAVDNFLDTEIGAPSDFGSGASLAKNMVDIEALVDDIGVAGAGLTALGDARLANLDATVSSRLSTAGYTAPDNTTIGTINTKIGTPVVTVSDDIAAIEAQTDDIGVAGAGLTALGDARIANLDAAISTRATPTNITAGVITTVTNLTNAPTAGDLTATMKASVNAEVLDVLNVDTFAQPGQEAPAATTTLIKMLAYLYKGFRNKKDQTATARKLYADNGTTVDQLATDSDDGTTYVKGELGSGP